MKRFNISEVNRLASLHPLEKLERLELYWRNLAQYLASTESKTLSLTLLDEIESHCEGFKEYVLKTYGVSKPMPDVEKKVDALIHKLLLLQRGNRTAIQRAKDWIFLSDVFYKERNTGVLYSALAVRDEDTEEMRHFKNLFASAISYAAAGYDVGSYRISHVAFEALEYFAPECMREVRKYRIKEYELYCKKARDLNAELDALQKELVENDARIVAVRLMNNGRVRLVE